MHALARRASICLAILSVGCGGGAECAIDSDCPNVVDVCMQNTCVPRGTILDGAVDGSADAGAPSDAGSDAAADAGSDGGACSVDFAGTWAIASVTGSCGTAVAGRTLTITSDLTMCQFIAISSDGTMPAVDGVLSAAGGTIAGNLNVGGIGERPCSAVVEDPSGNLVLTCPDPTNGDCSATIMRM